MDVTPFAGGLLVGILMGIGATAGGAFAAVGWLIHRAPHIPDNDPAGHSPIDSRILRARASRPPTL